MSPEERKNPEGRVDKAQLDAFLASDSDEEKAKKERREKKPAPEPREPEIIQTLKLPALELPGGEPRAEAPARPRAPSVPPATTPPATTTPATTTGSRREPARDPAGSARLAPADPARSTPPARDPRASVRQTRAAPVPPGGLLDEGDRADITRTPRKGVRPEPPAPPRPTPFESAKPTAELPPELNPMRLPSPRDPEDEKPTAELPPELNPMRILDRLRAPGGPGGPVDPADEKPTDALPPELNPMRLPPGARTRAAAPPPQVATPPLQVQESTWELPLESALKREMRRADEPAAFEAKPNAITVGLGEPGGPATFEVDSQRQLGPARPQAPEPRRRREPSWTRFGQVSSVADDSLAKAAPHADLPRGTTIGPFRIDTIVARGNAFTRYAAFDPDGEVVLLEVSPAGEDVDAVEFVRTAQVAARLDDPHLVRVLDAGEDRGRLYVAYEGWRWRTLEHAILRNRPRAERSARAIREAALGLATAHAVDLAHGSLTALDVLVDEVGRSRVIGLARPRRQSVEPFLATPLATRASFAPPEQARRPRPAPDAMVDVHALGALLYTAIALQPPHAGSSEPALERAVRSSPPPFVRDVTIACPPALEGIVARAMARRPERRYASAAALAEDLERFVQGGAVDAPLVRGGARLGAALLRRKGLAAVAGAAALAVVVAVATGGGPPSTDAPVRALVKEANEAVAVDAARARKRLADAAKLDPTHPELLRALPRASAALADQSARARTEKRRRDADALAEEASRLVGRAGQLRTEADRADRERARLEASGVTRQNASAWATLEQRRRRSLAEAAAQEGEAHAKLLVAVALDPQGKGNFLLQELERSFVAWAIDRGEPAALAFEQAATRGLAATRASRISLATSPARAEVTLERYVARGPRLVLRPFDPARPDDDPAFARALPKTTPVQLELLPGSYVATFRHENFAPARYAIHVPAGPGKDWDVQVTLIPLDKVEPGWAYVPGGLYWSATRGEWSEVAPFLITEGEVANEQGPVRGLSARAAQAFAQALGARVRLPRLPELEKAYRGADGRRFPWGNEFELSLVRGRWTRGAPDATPSRLDVSPYGVADLAGNLAEWALVQSDVPLRVAGSFRATDPREFEVRGTRKDAADPELDDVGFHAVKSLR